MPQTEKETCFIYIYGGYLPYLQSNASGSFFCKKCINFAEQIKFSHFKDNIIP